MIRKLMLAAAVALLVVPAFAAHRIDSAARAAAASPPRFGFAAVVEVEPLLPSGHFF